MDTLSLNRRIPVAVPPAAPPPARPALRVVREETPADLHQWRRSAWIAGGVLAGALAYAITRYVILGSVAAQHVPAYVMNKALAVTGLVLLAACLCARGPQRKSLGVIGFASSAVHGVLTLVLLGPAYYGKFYQAGGKLSLQGELMMLFGVLSLAALVVPALASFTGIRDGMSAASWKKLQRAAVAAFYLAFAHVVAMGVLTWLAPSRWPHYLPPITLVSAAVCAFVTLRRRAR